MDDIDSGSIREEFAVERHREMPGFDDPYDAPIPVSVPPKAMLAGVVVGKPGLAATCHRCGERLTAHDRVLVRVDAPYNGTGDGGGEWTVPRVYCRRHRVETTGAVGEVNVVASARLGIMSLPGRDTRHCLCAVEIEDISPPSEGR